MDADTLAMHIILSSTLEILKYNLQHQLEIDKQIEQIDKQAEDNLDQLLGEVLEGGG